MSINRLRLFLLTLGLCLFVNVHSSVQAQGSPITYPPETEVLRGVVQILGTADHPDFWKYELAATQTGADNWFNIGVGEARVQNGVLGQWNTATVGDGPYTLRLRIVKRDGNYDEYFVRSVQVANTQPAAPPTPAETPTPTITPTLEPATATPVVITPDIPTPTPVADLATTPTSTPPPAVAAADDASAGSTTGAAVSADSGGLPIASTVAFADRAGAAFMRGARIVLLVFVSVGIFFGVKNLLTWLYYRYMV